MSVVTRFPPSPTGFMHIGNARTALFNWLFSKHHGGKFLLRIEDTDRARHNEAAVQVIKDGLAWMGLDYDNDPVSQYENRARHAEIAHILLEKGSAYRCYCSPEELETMREEARTEGRAVAYDRRWRDRDPADAPDGIAPVIRIKAPINGKTTIHDAVQGDVTKTNDQLDDFVILRSDGTPTYMLAVVVDDFDMGVTHVIRGDDHLNNAFRQKIIYDQMGWDLPVYAHLPLIHGPDGAKFSKRHGAQSVEEYREMGYLPEALNNYLMRLGWSHGDDEIIDREQAIKWFDLAGVNKSAARFDFTKLESVNAHYIAQKDPRELLYAALPFFPATPDDAAQSRIIEGIEGLKDRSKTLKDFAAEAQFYITAPENYNEGALKNMTADALQNIYDTLDALQSFDKESVLGACNNLAKDHFDGKLGKVGMPLRAALTGSDKSPAIFEAAAILGKDETLARLNAALNHLNA